MRILGIDYGDVRIGIAVSDITGLIAQSVGVISEKDDSNKVKSLEEYINMYKPEKIVLGYPLNMNGTIGERAEKSLKFKEELEKFYNIPVILWDERLSSIAAHRVLEETGVSGKKRKGKVDPIAAAFILQSYLDSRI
ncbi:MAG: Holliday junction resolvase RuvX [Bacillota bacterium]|nr:Holliday junction resolvase RuvX [Bacillota bacterium]